MSSTFETGEALHVRPKEKKILENGSLMTPAGGDSWLEHESSPWGDREDI